MIRKFLLALMLVVSAASCVFAQQSTPAPDVTDNFGSGRQ